MEEKIVNLCPHSLKLIQYGAENEIKSSGVARVEAKFVPTGMFCGVVDGETQYGEITGLPAPADGVLYVVSSYVRDAAKALGRTDVRVPAECVRDPETGHVLYAKAITR